MLMFELSICYVSIKVCEPIKKHHLKKDNAFKNKEYVQTP
jgi:hypothetical protein